MECKIDIKEIENYYSDILNNSSINDIQNKYCTSENDVMIIYESLGESNMIHVKIWNSSKNEFFHFVLGDANNREVTNEWKSFLQKMNNSVYWNLKSEVLDLDYRPTHIFFYRQGKNRNNFIVLPKEKEANNLNVSRNLIDNQKKIILCK